MRIKAGNKGLSIVAAQLLKNELTFSQSFSSYMKDAMKQLTTISNTWKLFWQVNLVCIIP